MLSIEEMRQWLSGEAAWWKAPGTEPAICALGKRNKPSMVRVDTNLLPANQFHFDGNLYLRDPVRPGAAVELVIEPGSYPDVYYYDADENGHLQPRNLAEERGSLAIKLCHMLDVERHNIFGVYASPAVRGYRVEYRRRGQDLVKMIGGVDLQRFRLPEAEERHGPRPMTHAERAERRGGARRVPGRRGRS